MKASKVKSLENMLRNGETVVQPVVGVSMLPMLDCHTDAVKLVKPAKEIVIGDVVMYRSTPKRYILHRVCGKENGILVIRGDNCVGLERVQEKSIVAVMDGYVKNGKYIPADNPEYLEYVKKVLSAGKPLIPEEWKYIVKLLRAAITEGDAPPAPEGLNWDRIFTLCENQQIASSVACVIPKLKPAPPEDIRNKFAQAMNVALKRMLLFDSERTKILRELEKEHIRFQPLKVIVIKELYPKAWMRQFSDNDILYDKARQADLVRIMTSLGYEAKSLYGVHDVFHKAPIFNFEMHKALFPEYSPYADFFTDITDRLFADESGGGRMSCEDFYLHFLAHYAKHHESSGSGLRPLGDLYLLHKHNCESTSFDRTYVDEALEKLGLVSFEKKMLSLSDDLFKNGEIEDGALRYIMSGGTYGNAKNAATNEISKKGRLGYLFSRVFIPYYHMKNLYPILYKLPFLLPVCWVIRIVKAVFNPKKRRTAKQQLSWAFGSEKQ